MWSVRNECVGIMVRVGSYAIHSSMWGRRLIDFRKENVTPSTQYGLCCKHFIDSFPFFLFVMYQKRRNYVVNLYLITQPLLFSNFSLTVNSFLLYESCTSKTSENAQFLWVNTVIAATTFTSFQLEETKVHYLGLRSTSL